MPETLEGRVVVRNFRHNRTHYADDINVVRAVFIKPYDAPVPTTKALCNVKIDDGVVMEPGTEVSCPTCKALVDHGL